MSASLPPEMYLTSRELFAAMEELSPIEMRSMLSYLSGRCPQFFLEALKFNRPELVPERFRDGS